MSRPDILVIALLMTAATASVATMLVLGSNWPEHPPLSDEQRLTRQTVFGSGEELPPIEKVQEMRPRW